MLQHDVNTFFSNGANFFRNFLLVVIDDVIGAEFVGYVNLAIVASGGNHSTVEKLRKLNSCDSNSGVGAEHQHRLARTNSRAPYQHVPGREEHQGNAGRLIEIQGVGNGNNSYRRSRNQLAISAID